jgi:putative peptide zinc metalloprotease protein
MTDTVSTAEVTIDAIRAAGLTVTHDGDDFVIGCPATGVYVAVPEPGAVLVRKLNAGATLDQATAAASEVAGEPVDGAEFVLALASSGMLASQPTGSDGDTGRTIKWVYGVSQHAAARLFGRTAWTLYGLAALLVLVILISAPSIRPTYADLWFVNDRALATLVSVPFVMLLGGIHESWHWLAGRALGVPAVFRITHRGPYLAFETDLTQIVALPRRKRYGPFLAGMAVDVTILAIALGLRLLDARAGLGLPQLLDHILAALAMIQCLTISYQWLLLFLRSDGYAIIANATRCHNLYRATALTTKRRVYRLTEDERAELAAISDHDRAVARWFSLVYAAGLVGVAWTMVTWVLPFVGGLIGWVARQLTTASPREVRFWTALGMVGYGCIMYLLPPVLAVRERRLRRAGRLL